MDLNKAIALTREFIHERELDDRTREFALLVFDKKNPEWRWEWIHYAKEGVDKLARNLHVYLGKVGDDGHAVVGVYSNLDSLKNAMTSGSNFNYLNVSRIKVDELIKNFKSRYEEAHTGAAYMQYMAYENLVLSTLIADNGIYTNIVHNVFEAYEHKKYLKNLGCEWKDATLEQRQGLYDAQKAGIRNGIKVIEDLKSGLIRPSILEALGISYE